MGRFRWFKKRKVGRAKIRSRAIRGGKTRSPGLRTQQRGGQITLHIGCQFFSTTSAVYSYIYHACGRSTGYGVHRAQWTPELYLHMCARVVCRLVTGDQTRKNKYTQPGVPSVKNAPASRSAHFQPVRALNSTSKLGFSILTHARRRGVHKPFFGNYHVF